MMKALCFVFVLSIFLFLSHAIQSDDFNVTHISQQELVSKLKEPNSVLIDIRTLAEVKRGYIPGSTHISLSAIQKDPSVLDQYLGKDLIFYCHSGMRVNALTKYLQKSDHPSKGNLFHLLGDYSAWSKSGNKVEK